MPRLNSVGGYAMGVGGHQGSINGVYVPDSYGPMWLNDYEVIFAQPSDLVIKIMNIVTMDRWDAQPNHPYNALFAGGNNWAAWANIPGIGLFAPNLHLPDAGLLAVGPDGAIGFRTQYHSNYGVEVYEMSGERWMLNTADIIYDLQLLGNKRAIWKNIVDHKIRTNGLPPCVQVGNAFGPKATLINGEWWVCYWSDTAGLILHPFNSTVGYTIVPLGTDAFGHDAISIGNVEKVAWSTRQGEIPEDYRWRDIDVTIEPRHELTPPVEVPIIGKDCWVGWFEFTEPTIPTGPGNCLLRVQEAGIVRDLEGNQIAQWVQGNSVEEIEQQVNSSAWPCIAYWDSRDWPRKPVLRSFDWICLQAYCKSFESPSQFEFAMRDLLASFYQEYTQVCLVCQCYTSNLSLTSNLIGIVPVFARLARDYPNVNMMLAFSDQGRATGLNDHPEVRPYWQSLFNGVTGEPTDMEIMPPDVWDVITQMHTRFAQQMIDMHPGNPEEAARAWTKMTIEQVLYSFPGEGWCWKSSTSTNPPSKDTIARLLNPFTGYDMLQASSVNGPKFLVDYPPHANDLTGQHAITNLVPTNWLAAPSNINVDILYYDTIVHRSDPNGMLIRFDVSSDNPVVSIDLDLLGDGEPSIPIMFLDEPRRDGRYCRALAFKPTVNGDWILRVTAKDNQGNTGYRDGLVPVHVEP